MKRILITGAFGQLGEACIKQLSHRFNILAVDLFVPDDRKSDHTLALDISDRIAVAQVKNKFRPDVILNLAAMTNVDGCERNPEGAQSANVDAVQYLADGFKGHFIQISTDYIFDGNNGPYSETDIPNPISVYGQTKWEADQYLESTECMVTTFRPNVVYGYTKYTKASFVKWVVDSLTAKKTINIVDDQWNNPTWTEELANVIERGIDKKLKGVFHYGGDRVMNRFEFAQIITDIFELDSSRINAIKTAELNQDAPRPLKSGMKTDKIEKALGIRPKTVETCLQEIRNQLAP
ncbi:MAG: SDR family oxidoreductase [Candidatus Marinimicrobia bacterium]|nr:SDR family oxidoreductase [Candidatus Neomarinimicrobiota bacterium]MBL7010332.1 SDR family oxidoreductase [Candidatus Neomarinimicrobiota bacterium]MBL7030040.1 SDR family oxidoreductase [Candidatus Neomarinimicrobiota bacterium]